MLYQRNWRKAIETRNVVSWTDSTSKVEVRFFVLLDVTELSRCRGSSSLLVQGIQCTMTITDIITPPLTARVPYLNLKYLEQHDNRLIASITSQQPSSNCPSCGTRSLSLHSHYQRTLQDMPVSGSSVTWILHVRRFRCRKKKCSQRIFCS